MVTFTIFNRRNGRKIITRMNICSLNLVSPENIDSCLSLKIVLFNSFIIIDIITYTGYLCIQQLDSERCKGRKLDDLRTGYRSVAVDGIAFSGRMFFVLYPIICIYLINLGIGMFLSTVYIFFRDINYLWPIICRIIMYASAIFYDVSILPGIMRRLLTCNPLYMCIDYFRQLIIHSTVPSFEYHLVLGLMSAFCLLLGYATYNFNRDKIALYV